MAKRTSSECIDSADTSREKENIEIDEDIEGELSVETYTEEQKVIRLI